MMKNSMSLRLSLVLCLLSLACSASAQCHDYLYSHVEVSNVKTTQENNKVSIAIYFDLNLNYVPSNEFYLLTPVVVSSTDTEKSRKLTPFILAGTNRAKVLKRNIRYGNLPDFLEDNPEIVVRDNSMAQSYIYTTEVPFEPWMVNANLMLDESLRGCANCDIISTSYSIYDNILRTTNYRLAYVSPKVEELKVRSDKYTATIGFPVNSTQISSTFANNQSVLNEVNEKVVAILNNKDLNASKIEIVGYASPEATVAYNKNLAEKRAAAFAGYLSSRYAVEASNFTSTGYGEDWNRAEELIRENSIGLPDATRQQVLDIIQSTPDMDARDAKIKAIDGGATYQRLLTEVWPKIRRTEYTISYSVRPFNVEEAKQLIKTNPKLLSLNEMYLVAKTYDPSSEEYKQVFDIASRLYPNEPDALINSAAAELEVGSYARALKVLPSLGNRPEALNNLGVATALSGNREQARTLLEQAAALGSAEAKHNLAELGF